MPSSDRVRLIVDALFATIPPRKLPMPIVYQCWEAALADLSDEAAQWGKLRALKECKFVPGPGEFRELANTYRGPRTPLPTPEDDPDAKLPPWSGKGISMKAWYLEVLKAMDRGATKEEITAISDRHCAAKPGTIDKHQREFA